MPDTLDQTPPAAPKDAQSKVPKRIDLSGCTFEGKQLSVAELQERERRSEYMEAFRKEIDGSTVILRRRHLPAKGNPVETKKVAKRARRYTANEIRKEYGIMKKPYKTKVENIMWCIVNKGPIDITTIGQELGIKTKAEINRKYSSAITTLYNALGDSAGELNYLSRYKEGGRYFYQLTSKGQGKSVEVLCNTFRAITNEKARIRTAQKKAKKADPPAKKVAEVDLDLIQDTIQKLNGIQNTIQELNEIKDIVQKISKIFGLKVEVSGNVEILFGWKKEKP